MTRTLVGLAFAGLFFGTAVAQGQPAAAEMAPQGSAAQDSQAGLDMVAKGNDGYLLLPEEMVVPANVEWHSWSPDGEYVLAVRREPFLLEEMMNRQLSGGRIEGLLDKKGSLCVWNRKKHTLVDILPLPAAQRSQVEAAFLPNSSTALLSISTTTGRVIDGASVPVESTSVVWVDCATKKTRTLVKFEDSVVLQSVVIAADPKGQYFAVLSVKHNSLNETAPPTRATTVDLVDASGKLVQSRRLPEDQVVSYILWSTRDGLCAPVRSITPSATPTALSWLAFSVPSLDSKLFVPARRDPEPTEPAKLDIQAGMHKINLGKSEREVMGYWLVGDTGEGNKPALICAGGRTATMSPTLNGITYVRDSGVFVRTMTKIDKRIIDEAKKAAEKTVLISNAKQVALALILYASDNNDVLPGSSGWDSLISPYLKNDSLMSGFVYTFTGGDMNKIEKPAETILGYIVGPGGRAVAYTDGHVKWVNDK